MIESTLREIAIKENGKFFINDYKTFSFNGSRSPQTDYKLTFLYRECKIEILIQIGNIESSRIETTLSSYIRPIDFEINSIDHFMNLFLRRKSRFKIKCKNENFKYFLEKIALPIFDNVIKTKNFSPEIYSYNETSKNKIIFGFHLGFENWIDVFEHIINFLKIIIDELNSENRFISFKEYTSK